METDNRATIEQIAAELELLDADLRAEIVLGALRATAKPLARMFTIYPQSTFTRNYDHDIMRLYGTTDTSDMPSLAIAISRNSIYDLLPEAVFHQSETQEQQLSYTAYRKLLKTETAEARKLFLPIDNELFAQRVQLEEKEREAILNFSSLKDHFLLDFWSIDVKVPLAYAKKLLQLLPYANTISNNLPLAFRCLSNCIHAEVTYKKEFNTRKIKQPDTNGVQLGFDFVLQQKELQISQPELHITILAKNTAEAAVFLEGDVLDFTTVFYDYFIPIEFELHTRIAVTEAEAFKLGEKEGSLMGISTIL